MAFAKNIAERAVILGRHAVAPGEVVNLVDLLGINFHISPFYINALIRQELQVLEKPEADKAAEVSAPAPAPVQVEEEAPAPAPAEESAEEEAPAQSARRGRKPNAAKE